MITFSWTLILVAVSDFLAGIFLQSPFLSSWGIAVLLTFYLLLLFGGALYFIMLSNFRSKEKMQKMRSEWSLRLHNDIGNDLASVAGRVEILKKKLADADGKTKDNLDKTQSILKQVMINLRFVFDVLDPEKQTLSIVLNKIRSEAEDMLATKNIKLDFRNELAPTKEWKIDLARIDKLYLAMKEAVGNIVKHSQATLSTIHIYQEKQGVRVEITDNGKGFDVNETHDGNGIKNLHRDARDAVMDAQISSKPGEGTKVSLLLLEL